MSQALGDPGPHSDGLRQQHVGQCRSQPSFICERNAQVLRAIPLWSFGRAPLLDPARVGRRKLDGTAVRVPRHQRLYRGNLSWGNRVRCYEPDARAVRAHHARHSLVEFDVPIGRRKASATSIRRSWGCRRSLERQRRAGAREGRQDQYLHPRGRIHRKPITTATCADLHHALLRPYRHLSERGLISQEDNQYQYRFRDNRRSRRWQAPVHGRARGAQRDPPMYLRRWSTAIRAPDNRTYAQGHDQWAWAMGPDQYDQR